MLTSSDDFQRMGIRVASASKDGSGEASGACMHGPGRVFDQQRGHFLTGVSVRIRSTRPAR